MIPPMKSYRLLLLLPVLALAACASKLTNDNLNKVHNGMSQAEVKKVLGNPTRVESSETLGIRGTTFYYDAKGASVQIVFLNDSVLVKQGSFQ